MAAVPSPHERARIFHSKTSRTRLSSRINTLLQPTDAVPPSPGPRPYRLHHRRAAAGPPAFQRPLAPRAAGAHRGPRGRADRGRGHAQRVGVRQVAHARLRGEGVARDVVGMCVRALRGCRARGVVAVPPSFPARHGTVHAMSERNGWGCALAARLLTLRRRARATATAHCALGGFRVSGPGCTWVTCTPPSYPSPCSRHPVGAAGPAEPHVEDAMVRSSRGGAVLRVEAPGGRARRARGFPSTAQGAKAIVRVGSR